MDFLGMGPAEILLVLVIAMIFLGPGKIADLGRQLGKAVNSFRKASSEITANVTREMDQMKIDAAKLQANLADPVQSSSASPKMDSSNPSHQISQPSPAPVKPSENIDSPGAGI